MIKAEVLLENKYWKNKKIKWPIFFNRLIKAFPSRYQFKNKNVNLSVLLSDNKNIKKLNKNFRNKNRSTDILSFPFNKKIKILKKIYIGDIIISYNFIDRPKSQSSKSFKEKLIRTFIHGFLHLLNFDHVKNKDYTKMLKEEELIYNSVISKLD